MLPTYQSQCPLYYLFSVAEPDYLVDPFAVFLNYVDYWECLSDATYAWLLRFSALSKRQKQDLG